MTECESCYPSPSTGPYHHCPHLDVYYCQPCVEHGQACDRCQHEGSS